jgi:hypothetical protein
VRFFPLQDRRNEALPTVSRRSRSALRIPAVGGGPVVTVGLRKIGNVERVEPRHGDKEGVVGSIGVKPVLDISGLLEAVARLARIGDHKTCGRRPDVMTRLKVPRQKLVDMTGSDQRRGAAPECFEQLASRCRIDEATTYGVLIRGVEEQGLVGEQRQAALVDPGNRVADEAELLAGGLQTAASNWLLIAMMRQPATSRRQ